MKDFVQEHLAVSMPPYSAGRSVVAAPGFLALPLPANRNLPVPEAASSAGISGRSVDPGPSSHHWYMARGKRALDIAIVLATLPMTLGIIAVAALLLWFDGGRPFYRQQRLGKGGREFSIWKLRTMVRDADVRLADYLARDPALRQEWETTQKLKKDPRITRVGAMLRATSIDELPQLWNVLKGDMSLVGPRPMMPEQLPLYGDATSYFALKPGITGIWQVSARNEHLFSYRAHFDTLYYATASLWGDLLLMVKTVGVVVRRTGY